jgi:hypothetical protein
MGQSHQPLFMALLVTTYHSNEKANEITGGLENQLTFHDLCDENHDERVKTQVQALLASVDDTRWERLVDMMVFQTNASGIFQEDHLYI